MGSRYTKKWEDFFQDHQCGVAMRGGAEVMIHAFRACADLHKDWGFLFYDSFNAFNEVKRSVVAKALCQEFRELLPHFLDMYSAETVFILKGLNGGEIPDVDIRSADGVQQGDPLAGFYFSLVLHPILKKVKSKFPNSAVLAYMDDISVAAPMKDLKQ